MDFYQYKNIIKNINVGKQLPDSVYIHGSAITALPDELSSLLANIATALEFPSTDWNILKLFKRDFKVAFLTTLNFKPIVIPL